MLIAVRPPSAQLTRVRYETADLKVGLYDRRSL